MRTMFVMLSILMLAVAQQNESLKYVQYDTDLIPQSVYKARRDSVMNMIGQDAVAVFYAGPERMRNADVDYIYRQADNFFYLTGFTEPNALLILVPKGITVKINDSTTQTVNEVLFVQNRNPLAESWTGRRYGTEGAMKLLGMQAALTNDKFKTTFMRTLFSGIKYLYAQPVTSDVTGELRELVQPIQSFVDNVKVHNSKIELRDPNAMVHTMRIVKSSEEITMLRKATEISVVAHNQAMMSVEPGMYEYELQGLYQYLFQRQGSEFYGYPCINGAGENSVILHYNTNRKKINNGDIVLSDCAAEYRDWARSKPS